MYGGDLIVLELIASLVIGFFCGALWGMWVGLKAFAAQRANIDRHLQDMSENVDELSKHMHDGMIAPVAVQGWIAHIRSEFTPARKWRG